MPVSLTLSPGTLYAFLLVLARVSGALIFVPLPGIRSAPEPVRAALALGFTLALYSRWPVVAGTAGGGEMAAWAAAEAALGIAIGLAVTISVEAFTLAAQVLGLQAGYAYASTIDPSSEADSGVLLVFAQLTAGMLFFALGLDREVLERVPAGVWAFGPDAAGTIVRLSASMFSVGVRLALPVVALLVMVDVALALLGRINAQLQLLSLAFPVKMLIALVLLAWISVLFPRILMQSSGHAFGAVARMLGI
jgi:flagellar biosynthetic protein FliR